MLKFKGNPNELVEFIDDLMKEYGEKTTIKELFIILEKEREE